MIRIRYKAGSCEHTNDMSRYTEIEIFLPAEQLPVFKEYPATCSCNCISKFLGVFMKWCLVTGTILFNVVTYFLLLILWMLCMGTCLIELHVFAKSQQSIAVLQRQLLLRGCVSRYRNLRRSEHLETLFSL